MTLLTVVAWVGLACTAAALGVAGLATVRPGYRAWASRALWAAFGTVSLALALLVEHVLSGRLGVFYVWENVTTSYPWWLRMAGVWGGQEGTFLLWTWAVLGATVVEDHRARSGAWRWARVTLLAVAVVLLVPTIVLELGVETSAFGLAGEGQLVQGADGPSPLTLRPEGEGLNPLLETPFMAIHPLLEFLAYGLMAVPFAYGLVGLTGSKSWADPARWWAQRAWLVLLSALTIGALWAYHVLSFGGYWIWDPVEVANVLPLLALTVFLHAEPARRRGSSMGLTAPTTAALAFVMVAFTDFVVRSGLWSSVHAFLPTGVSAAVEHPGRRLLVTIQQSFPARYAVGLLSAALGAFGAAASVFHVRTLDRGSKLRGVAGAGAVVFAIVGLAGLFAPTHLVRTTAHLTTVLGFGDPVLGLVGLVALAGAPLLAGLFAMPEGVEVHLRERSGQLIGASALLAITFAATALLLTLGVNGYGPEVFTSRAPFLAAPILALIGLAFPGRAFQRWAWAVAAALVVGGALKLFTGSWAWAALPVAGVPFLGALVHHVRTARPTASGRGHLPTVLLTVAGLAGVVHGASPGVVALAGSALALPVWYAPVALAGGIGALAAPYLDTRSWWPRWAGPALAVLGVGYGLGVVLGLAAAWADRSTFRGPRGPIREGGLALVHAGLALLVLGVAVSTYGATTAAFDTADPLVRGEERVIGERTVELVDGSVVDEDGDGRADRATAIVHVREGGVFVGEETLSMTFHPGTGFAGRGSMVPDESPVTRSWWGDLAHNADTSTPLSMRIADGNQTWVAANGPAPDVEQAPVEAVSMGVKALPLANLVWAGPSLLAAGMVLRLAGTRGAGR